MHNYLLYLLAGLALVALLAGCASNDLVHGAVDARHARGRTTTMLIELRDPRLTDAAMAAAEAWRDVGYDVQVVLAAAAAELATQPLLARERPEQDPYSEPEPVWPVTHWLDVCTVAPNAGGTAYMGLDGVCVPLRQLAAGPGCVGVVVTHEIGHLLGGLHCDDQPGCSVLHSQPASCDVGISDTDIAAVEALGSLGGRP